MATASDGFVVELLGQVANIGCAKLCSSIFGQWVKSLSEPWFVTRRGRLLLVDQNDAAVLPHSQAIGGLELVGWQGKIGSMKSAIP